MYYAFLYVFTVVFGKLCFLCSSHDRITRWRELWSPVALIVGFIFVIRDYAQREIGHYVLPAMLLGGVLSWYMASPEIAFASLSAFLTGELIDWGVYSFTGRPFFPKVLLSSALSTPVDSAVFLYLIGVVSIPAILIMTASKMAGALLIFYLARKRERKTLYLSAEHAQ